MLTRTLPAIPGLIYKDFNKTTVMADSHPPEVAEAPSAAVGAPNASLHVIELKQGLTSDPFSCFTVAFSLESFFPFLKQLHYILK